MLLDLRLETPPAELAVSLDEAKVHLRLEADDTDEDDAINGYLAAAIGQLDGYTGVLGRALVTQTWQLSLEHFPGHHGGLPASLRGVAGSHRLFRGRRIHLPLPPLISVDEIAYVDGSGVSQVLAADKYVVLDGPLAAIEPAFGLAWPATRCQSRAVTVTFTAGYGAAADVPEGLKAAIKQMVGDMHINREAVVIGPRAVVIDNPTVARLIRPFRVAHI